MRNKRFCLLSILFVLLFAIFLPGCDFSRQEVNLTEIELVGNIKTEYFTSDTRFDIENCKLKLKYSDGTDSHENLKLNMLSDFDNSVGVHTCTISYGGKTTNFNYEVKAVAVERIAVKNSPKTLYYANDTMFDITGAKLTCINNDGTSFEVDITSNMLSAFNASVGVHTCKITYQDIATIFEYTVRAFAVESISIKTSPKTMYYTSDNDFDLSGATIECLNSDGTKVVVSISSQMVSVFDRTEGPHTCTVTYAGKTTTFEYVVEAVVIESISIKTSPKTMYYTSDNDFDLTGATIECLNSDGTKFVVSISSQMVSVFDRTEGPHTCTVTYAGKTTTFEYVVEAVVIESISIKTSPETMYYTSDDDFDLTGATIECLNSDGTKFVVSISKLMLSAFDNSIGDHICTITYGGETVTFEYTVLEVVLENVTIKSLPKITYFESDDDFDLTGATIECEYSDGTTFEVAITEQMLNDSFDNSVGEHFCDVSYAGFVVSFDYEVEAVFIEYISLRSTPETIYYTSDTDFDLSDIRLTAYYNDGNSFNVLISNSMLSAFDNSVGEHICTITYRGLTTQFSYFVHEVEIDFIEIEKSPQTLYSESDNAFVLDGATLTCYYNDGATNEVEITNAMLSAFDNSVGTHTCTVTYEGQTATFIYIVEADAGSVYSSYSLLDDIDLRVEDQGATGLCYAYAATTMAESYFNLMYGVDWQFDVSHIALVSNERYPRGEGYLDPLMTGGGSEHLIECLKNFGLKIEDGITDSETLNNSLPVVYFSGYIDFSSEEEIKEYIMQYGAVCAPVYIDDEYTINEVDIYNLSGASNHLICIIGWDDEKQAWLCMNSWGSSWKEDGCFYLSYGYKIVVQDLLGQDSYIDFYDKAFGVEYGYFASKIDDEFSDETIENKATVNFVYDDNYYAVIKENNMSQLKIDYVEIVGDLTTTDVEVWIFESDTNTFNNFDFSTESINLSGVQLCNYQCPVTGTKVLNTTVNRFVFENSVTITKRYYIIVFGNADDNNVMCYYNYRSSEDCYYAKDDNNAWVLRQGEDLLVSVGFAYTNEIESILQSTSNKYVVDFEFDLSSNVEIESTIVADYGYENGNFYVVVNQTGYVTLNYNDEYSVNLYFEYVA